MSLTQEERDRIVKDIVNHKVEEVEVGAGNAISTEELDELEASLRESSDDELENWWDSTVGEWIASMSRWSNDEYHDNADGMGDWEAQGYDNVVEWQFDKLVSSGETDYGYRSYRYSQPY